MTVYGDLEISTLSQLPRGRSPIASHVVPAAEKPAFLDRAWRRLREEVAAGHQAYVVCPRIGDGRRGRRRTPPRGRTTTGRPAAAGGARGGAAAGRGAAARAADRRAARPAAGRREGRGDARLRRRRARRAGRHHGDRGRRGRAERHRDDRAGRRPVRRLPAAPAARPGRPGLARPGSACWSPRRRRVRRPGSGSTRSPPPWTASSWPSSTWSSAARATCWARPSPGAARTCGCCRCCGTPT